jgi:hypothetical protein
LITIGTVDERAEQLNPQGSAAGLDELAHSPEELVAALEDAGPRE